MKELLFYNARIDNQGLAICVSNKDKVVKFTINDSNRRRKNKEWKCEELEEKRACNW